MNLQLLIIDPQNDFCHPDGALYVPGAQGDAARAAQLIKRLGSRIDKINLTLDNHHCLDIGHPVFWLDSAGNNPEPFTIITRADLEQGRYRTSNPAWLPRASDYLRQLEVNGRYPLCIWPYHCLIGSWGSNIEQGIAEAVIGWECEQLTLAQMITKGTNCWTEHYSAIRADVPDPADPTTQLNQGLLASLKEADLIAVLGQAKSHCLANTVKDIAAQFSAEDIKKLVLIEDCTSNVAGFEQLGEEFVAELSDRGMLISTADTFLL